MKTALVLGASGFIGTALTTRLMEQGYWVRGVDCRYPPFGDSRVPNDFRLTDLRDLRNVESVARPDGVVPRRTFDEVYQLACNMGGAGFIFTGEHDAEVIADNVTINANVARTFSKIGCGRLLYTSSSCVYNDAMADARCHDGNHAPLQEHEAAWNLPSNSYGWEKLFSEELYLAHKRNFALNVCITRFSTIYGPGSAFDNGREKAVAAICRKVIDAPHGGEVEVWGDGQQIRPLVYIDDLIDAITGLVRCETFDGPVNIANTELTTCNEVAQQAIALSNKRLTIKNVPGPIGKQELLMTTDLAQRHFGWRASTPFSVGLERTFDWIARQKHARAA